MMNMPIKIVILSLLFSLLSPFPSLAESVLERVKDTGVVKLAIREDASPFGYLDQSGNLQGYCLDFFALLRHKLTQELNRDVIAVRLLKSRLANRFELVERGFADLECGPNTIRDNISYKIGFSQPFFLTGTQFLIKDNLANILKLNNPFADLTIGLIAHTTTEEFISKKYPRAKVEKFQGITARMRGIQALQQGKIDAFISDGILLRGEADLQNLSSQAYSLIPKQPITCDYYGMIIPQNDAPWRDFVNGVIASQESEKIFTKWFKNIIPYTIEEKDFCQK